MIHPEERLYGWGICGITMPRALDTTPADKRKTGVAIPFAIRRKVASKLWCTSGVSRIFIDDFPWSQALLMTFVSTVILASISVMNSTFPIQQVERLSKPVDIIVSVLEEESQKNISAIQEKKPLPKAIHDHVEQEVTTKTAMEKQPEIIVAKLKESKQPVSVETPVKTPIEPLPDVKEKLSTDNKPVKESQIIAFSAPLVETKPEYEKITISPPSRHQYNNSAGKNGDRVLQRMDSDVETIFESKSKIKVAKSILPADRPQRKFKSTMSKQEESGNSARIYATDISAFHRLVEPAEVDSPDTGQADHLYAREGNGSRHSMQNALLRASQQVSFQTNELSGNSKLEPQRQVKYFPPRSSTRHSASQQSLPTTGFPTLQQQIPSYGSVALKGRLSDELYTLPVKNRYQSIKHESTNEQSSFQPQKQEEDLMLAPPASMKSFANESEVQTKSPALLSETQDFSGEILPDQVDPSELISLKEFNVCTDPEEEFHLKTQLAVRLDGPFWIQTGSVLFFFKHPESGYTIQTRIYNPHGRIFRDRCEILQLALRGILHRTK
jgi:hypothetical protein